MHLFKESKLGFKTNGAEFSPATLSRFFSRLSNHEKASLKGGRVSPRLFVQRFKLSDAHQSEGD
jgi:hypothetical protein